MKNAVNWFDIPANDFERAVGFYNRVFDVTLTQMENSGTKFAMFPFEPSSGVGGAISHGNGNTPSLTGPLVYLNGGEDLSQPLSRVVKAGGKVLMDKTSLGPNGFMAVFSDTEGNRVALHSMK